MSETIERVLSYAERARYGRCPVYDRPHGEACDANRGIPLGRNVYGETPPGGVHLARLQNAPRAIREVPIA